MRRRSFLKTMGEAGTAAALVAPALAAGEGREVERVAGMPRRVLGRTGQKISIVGFPGLALVHHDQERCTAGLHDAFRRGINYFDVAPAYGNGDAETKMGVGLVGLPRDKIFLACKTKARDKAGARAELDRSLARLKTDHFDLYQLHHLRFPEEVKQALGPGGAIETLLEARKEGKVKYLGFSAHTTKGAVLALEGFDFDTVMFPINFVELLRDRFGAEVLEAARKRNAGVLAIKAMSRGLWAKNQPRTRKWWYRSVEEPQEVGLALRYTWSQPGVCAAFSPAFLDLMDKAIAAATTDCRTITEAEVAKLEAIAKTCESVFQREEKQVAWNRRSRGPLFGDCPYECPCEQWG